MRDSVSVVIPAFNEENRLGTSLSRIRQYFAEHELDFELVVVDDGSSDATLRVAYDFSRQHSLGNRFQLLANSSNRGKGFSVRRGMLACRCPFARMTDSDLSTPIEEFEKLHGEMLCGPCDVTFGSRDLPGSTIDLHQSWFREHAGKAYNRAVRLLTGLPFKDTQCGFKLFRMASCRPVFEVQKLENFAFDVEVLFIAHRWGHVLKEIPVRWHHSPGTKVRFSSDAPRMFFDLFRIRRNYALGVYARGADSH
jgi:glycosyltransferase involved in cell wall biosynthesis